VLSAFEWEQKRKRSDTNTIPFIFAFLLKELLLFCMSKERKSSTQSLRQSHDAVLAFLGVKSTSGDAGGTLPHHRLSLVSLIFFILISGSLESRMHSQICAYPNMLSSSRVIII
jgi:hypothetical protein